MKNEYIQKRKSVRKYEKVPLDNETLEKIKNKIENVKPLYEDIKYSIELIEPNDENKNDAYQLVFGSEDVDGGSENVGFIGQQLNLYFAELGLGSYWHRAKAKGSKDKGLPYVVSMAFGKSNEPIYRELSEFKRKPLSKISEGNNEHIKAARLAPSGLNAQNWFFIAENGKIHCYRKKLNVVTGLLMNKLSSIDIGIAICHIYKEIDNFKFSKDNKSPEKKGYIYTGTVYS